MSAATSGVGETPAGRRFVVLGLVGLAAGLLSGLFGVGGGTIIVPALVTVLGFNRRLASGTSLAAIAPTALVGAVSYGAAGQVSIPTAVFLAVGTVLGAQLGSWLLSRLSQQALRWAFVVFLSVVAVQLMFTVPTRGGTVELTWPLALAELGVGVVVGTVSGLLGVGGGVIVVPAMMLLFGYSDLVAKGTSLLAMIPTAISGTVGNLRRGNVDLRAGLVVGIAACATVPVGSWVAGALDPRVANWLFVLFLAFLVVRTVLDLMTARRRQTEAGSKIDV